MTFYAVYCAGKFVDFFDTKYEACQFVARCRLSFHFAGEFAFDDAFEIKEEEL